MRVFLHQGHRVLFRLSFRIFIENMYLMDTGSDTKLKTQEQNKFCPQLLD